MKNIFLFIGLSLLFASCTKMLEEKPEDRLFSAGFYKTSGDAVAAVNAAYALLGGNEYYGFRGFNVIYTPMEDYATGRGQYVAHGQYQGLPSSVIGITDAIWSSCYRTINASNIVLKYVPAISMNETQKNSFLSEARFLRALSYYNLVRAWGGVPIKTEPTENPEATGGKREAVADVYALIIEDLKFAEANLLPRQTQAGRATSWAAKTMLADVYLTREDWTNARIKADEVIQSGAYSLVRVSQAADFEQVFGADVVTSSEDVFSVKFARNVGLGSQHPPFFHNSDAAWAARGFGTFYGFPTYPLLAQWDNNDLRKSFNLYTQYPNKAGVIVRNSTAEPIRFGKFKDAKAQDNTAHSTPFPIYRYPDVLLIFAEAVSQENGGPTALGLERLNMVRRRAYGHNPNAPSQVDFILAGQTVESFRNLLLRERAYEFLVEGGKRWRDLIRTNTVRQVIKAAKGIDVATAHLLFPIPKQEIDNNPDISSSDQNPGY